MPSTIFVTTPCLDAIETLDRTILSVVTQTGDFFIRYHVQDGGSTDGTPERLGWWQRRLATEDFPLQCLGIEFTFSSAPDAGMYDGLCKGFEAMRIGAGSFMTWINADDMLMPGAFAFISDVERQFKPAQASWVGGAVSILMGNVPNFTNDCPIPRAAIQAGLCDGTHWHFLQQEGTFFRKWLWDAIAPDETVRPMKLAGDWNLWRLFANHACLAQAKFPLGSFRIQPAQLSVRLRDEYMEEINSLVPAVDRKAALHELAQTGSVYRRAFQQKFGDRSLTLLDELKNAALKRRFKKVFGEDVQLDPKASETRLVHEGEVTDDEVHVSEVISCAENVVAFDWHWQFPAITEQHAFQRIRDLGCVPDTVTYVAYPWATLIDKLQTGAADAHIHMAWFRQFCRRIPKETVKVTVCQHVKMLEFLHLFEEAGISDIFWSHATQADVAASPGDGPRVHAFPLYPVQSREDVPGLPSVDRPYLFAFIGARANRHYLTRTREWILDLLADHPRSLIIGRDGWHYEKIVYEHQIRPDQAGRDKSDALLDQSASDKFKTSLAESVFSLCPSGSGPNSIRLWESLGAGAIPVILADTWAPPGDLRLWDLAVVFCEETPDAIKALPERLEEIAAEPARLVTMRHAMRQLWLLYGPQGFVNDVQALFLAHSCDGSADAVETVPDSGAMPEDVATARQLLLGWSNRLLLDAKEALPQIEADPSLQAALAEAQELVAGSGLAEHFVTVLNHARKSVGLAAPGVQRCAGPKICLFGRHSNRTPLSYAPIRKLIGDRVVWAEAPEQADLVVTGFNIDLRENAERLLPLRDRAGGPRFVVMSEEPLWDVTWSGPFTGRDGRISVRGETLPYLFLGHETSDIFTFEDLPYFVLTDDRYALRYADMMARQAEQDRDAVLTRWETAPIRAAFFAEYRKGEPYTGADPERDVARLSAYRTEVAESFPGDGVLRAGTGWGGEVRRQELPDWHLDKLAHLDGRSRIVAAYENVHQRAYISEKIFDAFAAGAIPAYWAGPPHRVFEFVPQEAMINTFGQEASEAAQHLADFTPDRGFAEAWLEACAHLRDRFRNFDLICKERRRVAQTALRAIVEVL